MELRYYGANCVKISTKKASIVIDDTIGSQGKKSITTDKDISLVTNKEAKIAEGGYFIVDKPGEYEISEVTITGVPSNLHYDPEKPSIIYSIHANGMSIAALGHTTANLTDEQIEALGVIDVLIIPVGGNGFTLDVIEAMKLIKNIEPKIVIPTHFASTSINYEVPQSPLDEFIKSFGSSDIEPEDVLKIKDAFLPEKTRLAILNELK